jgi:hypothetical protein
VALKNNLRTPTNLLKIEGLTLDIKKILGDTKFFSIQALQVMKSSQKLSSFLHPCLKFNKNEVLLD